MTVKRISGRALQTLRKRWFSANPLCVMCTAAGRVTAATELDHIVALTNGGTNEDSNYQGLCDPCHEIKTAADLGYEPLRATGADGWPTDDVASNVPRWRRAMGTGRK